MCGLLGFWSHGEGISRLQHPFQTMLADIHHRGPDDTGVSISQCGRVWLGHKRLSILDTSDRGRQPMWSADGAVALIFNGEIYNFRLIRRELEAAGEKFTSESDSEVLLRGYQRWGRGVVERLVGMFAFAIWDARRQELFIARDRLGEKPLYYAGGAWGFAFGSEIRPLARLPCVDTTIDSDAVALFLAYQYIPAPKSIYRGVSKLPPGTALVVTTAGLEHWQYWTPLSFSQNGESVHVAESERAFEALFEEAVSAQMESDVPLGAFLSGGYDSTAVVAMMVRTSKSPIRTFTIGFDDRQFDESLHAERVATHLGTDHTTYRVEERDILDVVPRLPGMFGEPFADSSAIPTHLVARMARADVKVCLSGDGADELFGGYKRYDWFRWLAFAGRVMPDSEIVSSILKVMPGRLGRAGHMIASDQSEMYARMTRMFTPDMVRLMGLTPLVSESSKQIERLASVLPPHVFAMLSDIGNYLPDDILVKVDRSAMAASLESRAPFLDHRVVEFALQLPAAGRVRKSLVKEWVHSQVPRELMRRPKKGFSVPIGRWLREELKGVMHSYLSKENLNAVGIGDYELVRRMVDRHVAHERDSGSRLWTLLMLCMWVQDERRTVTS